ncbi:MAG TPA: hypothetical protein VF530_02790 [Planctomycetota bacterium]
MAAARVDALRRWGALLATGVAAVLCLRWPRAAWSPDWPIPDGHQASLTLCSERLAELLADVPREAPLGFLAHPGPGELLDPATNEGLEHLKATLAPRRLVEVGEAEWVVAHARALVQLSKLPGFERLDTVEPLVPGWVLVERGPR